LTAGLGPQQVLQMLVPVMLMAGGVMLFVAERLRRQPGDIARS
jgi:hypothetical protein